MTHRSDGSDVRSKAELMLKVKRGVARPILQKVQLHPHYNALPHRGSMMKYGGGQAWFVAHEATDYKRWYQAKEAYKAQPYCVPLISTRIHRWLQVEYQFFYEPYYAGHQKAAPALRCQGII